MRGSPFAELGKHQLAAFAATAVDFGCMIALVELASMSPVVATIAGATCGAITNFALGRGAVFRATTDPIPMQALRYALVSATSLALNAVGVHILADNIGAHYLGARLAISFIVSVAWNYPLQRSFVFRRPSRELAG
jgi:putative flippase GtrA